MKLPVWPIFLPRAMYEDLGAAFAVGDQIAWDVVLVDSAAGDWWPAGRAISVTALVKPRPGWARRGAIAAFSGFEVCWETSEQAGSEVVLSARLEADWFNPPFRTSTTGEIRRIEVVSTTFERDRDGVAQPVGDFGFRQIPGTAHQLASWHRLLEGGVHDMGFVFQVEVDAISLQPRPGPAP